MPMQTSGVTMYPQLHWRVGAGRLGYMQFTCLLSNTNDFPILSLNMTCDNFFPVSSWNINSDCTFPFLHGAVPEAGVVLRVRSCPGSFLRGPRLRGPAPGHLRAPPSDPTSQLSLTCGSVGKPYISKGTFVYSFGCTVSTTVHQRCPRSSSSASTSTLPCTQCTTSTPTARSPRHPSGLSRPGFLVFRPANPSAASALTRIKSLHPSLEAKLGLPTLLYSRDTTTPSLSKCCTGYAMSRPNTRRTYSL